MTKVTMNLYPTLKEAHNKIDELNATIVQYEGRETQLIDMLQRISEITEECEA